MIEEARKVLESFTESLADVLADSTLAAWLRGAGRVVADLPNQAPLAVDDVPPVSPPEATPSPAVPVVPIVPVGSAIEPPAWNGMKLWLPLVEKAHEDLVTRKVLLKEDYVKLETEARKQAFTVAQLNTQEAVGKVRDAVAEAVTQGHGLETFVDQVEEAIGTSTLGVGHLENVFRTNVAQSYAAGQEAILDHPMVDDLFPYIATMPIRDSRLTDLCGIISVSGLDGTAVFRRDDPVWEKFKPPRHYQCFIPGTKVQGRFLVGLKTFYSGEVVEITTRLGNRLTVTVNHPVLTPCGFVAANEISEGDHLLCYTGGIKERTDLARRKAATTFDARLTAPAKNEEYPPTAIEEVFASLANFFNGPARRSPTTPDDLYGDAAFGDGYVEVVGAYRELGIDVGAGISDSNRDFRLVSMDAILSQVMRLGVIRQRDNRPCAASNSVMRVFDLAQSCLGIHPRPLHGLRFGLASKMDASRYKMAGDNAAVNAFRLAQSENGFASDVAGNEFIRIGDDDVWAMTNSDLGCLFQSSEFNASAAKYSGQAERTDSEFAAELIERFPGLIAADDVVKVRKYDFRGHVYDLQSEGGWLVANGIVSSNCRCGQNPLTVKQAAARGVSEAIQWLRTGIPPAHPEHVPHPPVELPPGWGAGGVRLSAINEYGVRLSQKDSGRWVTIGGSPGEDGKRHGGSPVYVENGRITKGHPGLTGKKIDALSEPGESGSHRKQLKQGKEHARAVWGKKARKEGLPSKDLHQLAADVLAHNKAFVDEQSQILKEARRALSEHGAQWKTLKMHADRTGGDSDKIKGLDEVAGDMAEKYPEHFHDAEHAVDTLYGMLAAGNPEPMSEDEAYEQAFNHLTEEKERHANRQQEEVPF